MKNNTVLSRLFKGLAPILGAIFLMLALSPGLASAQTSKKLGDYLSYQEQVVVGVNFNELRKSKYFSAVTNLAQSGEGLGEVLGLLDDAGIDFSTDITALAAGVPTLDLQKSLEARTYSVAISGNFDSDKLLAALKAKKLALKPSTVGKHTLYTVDNIAFTFPKKGVLLVTSGPDAYRTRALSALKGSDKSVTKSAYFKRISTGLNTTQGAWAVANAASDPSASAGGAQANEMAMSLDVSSGFIAEILLEMATEKGAAETVKATQAQVKEFATNPMVAMTGAKPLLTNLKLAQKGTRITTTTRLSASELDVLVQRAGGLIKTQLQNQTGAAPAKAAPAPKPKAAPSKAVKADFN